MPSRQDEPIQIGSFTLHVARRQLLLDGALVRIGDRALDILVALASRPGEVLPHDALRSAAWPGRTVDESALRVHLSALRRILAQDTDDAVQILNLSGRGYQLVAPAPAVRRPASPVPASPAEPIGRAAFLASIDLAAPMKRLATIVGPGGMGKTMMALAIVQERAAAYPDGVAIIDFGALPAGSAVAAAAADGLDLSAPDDEAPAAAIARHLKSRRFLLVLDTCEHVVAAVVELAETLLKAAPQLEILATSREPLRCDGEWIHRLPPLDWPRGPDFPSAEQAMAFPAVRLFVARAAAVSTGFALEDADVPVVAEICRSLDGIPLALELAAARIGLFGLRGLAARIGVSPDILRRGSRTAVARHHTLRANLEWSFALLTPQERILLRVLGTFATAIEFHQVLDAAAGVLDEQTTRRCLAVLVAKSLAVVDPATGTASYRLLETTRTYIAGGLTRS